MSLVAIATTAEDFSPFHFSSQYVAETQNDAPPTRLTLETLSDRLKSMHAWYIRASDDVNRITDTISRDYHQRINDVQLDEYANELLNATGFERCQDYCLVEFQSYLNLRSVLKIQSHIAKSCNCSLSEAHSMPLERVAELLGNRPTAEPIAVNVRPPKKTKAEAKRRRGDAAKIIEAALCAHHRYENRSCGNYEPIGLRELGKLAGYSPAKVSQYFKDEFQGYDEYRQSCCNPDKLHPVLSLVSGDFKPSRILNSDPGTKLPKKSSIDQDED